MYCSLKTRNTSNHLDEDGYLTSSDLHEASKMHNMLEVIEVASELKTKCNVQCEVREIQVVKR